MVTKQLEKFCKAVLLLQDLPDEKPNLVDPMVGAGIKVQKHAALLRTELVKGHARIAVDESSGFDQALRPRTALDDDT